MRIIALFLLVAASFVLGKTSADVEPTVTCASSDGHDYDFFGLFPSSVKTVGVVMPASVYERQKFVRGVEALRNAGYRVKVAPRIRFDCLAPPFDRAADLVDVWTDPDVDLVICARGGHGVEKILPYVDWNRLHKRPNMVFLGFSDITILHNALLKEKVGHPISGPTMSSVPRSTLETRQWLHRAIAGERQPPITLRVIKPGAFSGLPCGGHAHRYVMALDSGCSVKAAGRVVFLESESSIGVELLRQTLERLLEPGMLDGAVGVIFGDMTPGSNHPEKTGRELFGEELKMARAEVERMKRLFASRIHCPVCDGFGYGHGSVNLAVDYLREVSVDDKGVMRWREGTPRIGWGQASAESEIVANWLGTGFRRERDSCGKFAGGLVRRVNSEWDLGGFGERYVGLSPIGTCTEFPLDCLNGNEPTTPTVAFSRQK